MSIIQSVQSIYAAFGRGDIPTIIERLAPDVQWEVWPEDYSPHAAGVPWLAARRGRDGVLGFFNLLGTTFDVTRFEVRDLAASERQVVAEIGIELKFRATGDVLRDEELHLWTFDDAGLVSRFRHYVDTGKHIALAQRQNQRA